jgi:DNA-binding transcriptional regulator YdaS (Cro superfamily)
MAWMSLMLVHALRLSDSRLYRHAQDVGVHPCTLSQWMNGMLPVKPDDPRILQLAMSVGVPPEQSVSDCPAWRQSSGAASRQGVKQPMSGTP